jgi:predicted GIY-YIG superfamily endonuclease
VPEPDIKNAVFYVYVLRSGTDAGFYIGFSSNLTKRLRDHENGAAFATSYRGPWKLIYYEATSSGKMLSAESVILKAEAEDAS